MKSFFASVECAERGLDPYKTSLVVADPSRGGGAITLAITPYLKTLGIKNRCRIFEIPPNINYIIALPRMKKYIEYASEIYATFLKYISKYDIHVYSIDESFIDVTDYLKLYKLTAREFAIKLMDEIMANTKIPSTVGIGTNLFLAKVALDITAKKSVDNIGYLDEDKFIKELWTHRPITDFWHIGKGISNRLMKKGIYDLEGVAKCQSEILYKEFGINAELLIDHAFGRESCTMSDIKAYKSKSNSVSFSQILFTDYSFDKARIVLCEMIESGILQLIKNDLVTIFVSFNIGYSKDVIKSTGCRVRLEQYTNLCSQIMPRVLRSFDTITNKVNLIRRISVDFGNVKKDDFSQYSFFHDYNQLEKEKNLERATLKIMSKYGKNSIIKAQDLLDGATKIKRNTLIGGHNSD